MQVAIVVVLYRSAAWVRACLDACRSAAPGVPVYAVDNASPDESAKIVATEFPEVHLLKQVQNFGFAGGNNIGIRAAMAAGAEAIFLLNPDSRLEPSVLPGLELYLHDHPKVAGVQPMLLLPNGRVNSVGNVYHYLGFGEAGGNGLTPEEARACVPWLKQGSEPPFLSGAASLWRAQTLQEVGLFDEELFVYHEDLELSLRCRLAGWQLGVDSNVSMVHSYEPSRSRLQFYYMERNRFLVWLWYLKLPTLLLLFVPWLMSEVGLLVTALRGGWIWERISALGYFFKLTTWKSIAEHRKKLRLLRTCTDSYLLSFAASKIEYHDSEVGGLTRYVFNPVSKFMWVILRPLIRW